MEKIILNARDGYPLDVHVFSVQKPKAVVQVIHGMEEHQERYEPVINFLNKNDYSVVSSNMRGHGENAKVLGFFKNKDGYKELINDQKTITSFIKEKFNNLPVYILAHSMGTIITRVLLQDNSSAYEKVILSGYPNYQSGAYFGIFLVNLIIAFRGPKYKSKFINKMSVGAFNKKIKNPKTDYDWICHNEEDIKEYIADPYCGFGFTCSAFRDLFHLVVLMHKPKKYKNVNTNLKLLLLRGTDDPCTGGNKGALDSRKTLTRASFKNLEYTDYENMRHEILNEVEKQRVYDDVLKFFNK